ncbi:hypothetical protein PV328_009265 [Microctonus aethiopoides]|uniref:Uncharacterized protein n=1 Tax=Microctonus aethiopoides TaxID=144406 RepID=A0AA39F0N7_9HYME|nr:hypothetical protein PV328_009265 [Microctonus aethiopoides]
MWLIPLFRYGKRHDLEAKDLQNTLKPDLSEPLGDALEKNWKKEIELAQNNQRKPRLRSAIKKTFMLSFVTYGVWISLTVALRILQPYILGLLLWHFDPRAESSPSEAYIYASYIIVLSIMISLLEQHANMGLLELGMRTRIACSSLVYRKILRLSRYSANKTAGGQVINLLSNDVARFDPLFLYLHYIWIMPIQSAIIAYVIWYYVGIASLAGIFLITIQTIPVQGYLGKWISKFRGKIATRTDERVRLMSEIIKGIQVIKMYTWEKPFQELVSLARKYEIDILTVMSYLRGINRATYVYTERTTLFFTILAFVLSGNNISADVVFAMAQYFNRLQCIMAIFYPMGVSALAEGLVSMRRLENFLLLDENIPLAIPSSSNNAEKNSAIKIKEVSASWITNSISNTLHNINITINPGELYALVGPVGSGKSSLLQLILSELQVNHGHIAVNGKISYASQEPWLFAGSVRNNILFGQPYDEKRYREVTRVCALLKDFIQLPQGDKTLVGEQGASLSGGQRARINLARAIYRDVDIYLLDDPLSAVDTQVSKSLFEDCIKGYLSNKTRILVTHQVQYLKDVDAVVMLNNGVIENQGKLKDFNEEHLNLLASSATEEKTENNQIKDSELKPVPEVIMSSNYVNDDEDQPQETEELIVKGGVSKSLYWRYFRAGASVTGLFFFLFITVLAQLGSSGTDWWLAYWTGQEEKRIRNELNPGNSTTDNLSNNNSSHVSVNKTVIFNETISNDTNNYYDVDTALWVYGILVITSVVMTTARNVIFYKICMNASKNLHNTMFGSLLRAPMRFFNIHPSGQILNRFSKDTGCVDELLPMAMIDSIQIFLVMIGILAQVLIVYWWTIAPIIIMGILYWLLRNLYLATAQDLKRLEGITKSPVFSHVNSSLAGLATIRSSGGQEIVRKEFDSHQDVHTGAYSLFISTSTAFGLWLDSVTISFVAFITYSFIYLHNDSTFAGSIGLVISQILILCGMMQYGMRQTAEMVAQMTSVERILQFTELDKEGPFDSEPNQKPPSTWPVKGRIIFDHVYLKYSDTDEPVLKDLNLNIDGGSKVGIVGRTGAGKSSIISALFNLAKLDGDIIIDDINIKKIGLHDLRSKISIIPQEPMLFSASLRDNLDPFHQYEDNVLWSALEDVELKVAVPSLDHQVTQGGTNFSAGQRQLLCLARAIVRNNKILVMDEATANVDPATDALIQTTIRNKFKDCTVLTIAHRLNTVMDSDRALVMDQGQIMEFDHPHLLLQNPNGYLMNMVNQTGKFMTGKLKKISEDAYNNILHDTDLKEHNLINGIPKS